MPLDLSALVDILPELVNAEVDVEELVNPSVDARGGPNHQYKPDPVETAVPCLILPRTATSEDRAMQRTGARCHTIYFLAAIKLGPTRRLKLDDATEGIRYLYPDEAVNLAESSAAWKAEAEEYPDP